MNKGIGYLFMFVIFVVFITDGQAKDIKESKRQMSIKYIASLYVDDILAIKPTSKGVASKKMIEKVYQRLLIDGAIWNIERMDFNKDLCRYNPSYKKIHEDYLKVTNSKKYNALEDALREEINNTRERLEYLNESSLSEQMYEIFERESENFNSHPNLTPYKKIGLLCGKNKQIHCALKIKDLLRERIIGLLNKIADEIDDGYVRGNKEERLKQAKKLNPKAVKKLLKEPKSNLIDDLEDVNSSVISLINDYKSL
jgi:hypothetical protein